MTFFGILSQRGHGHAASMLLIAMFAMLLTAISYGRMARAYPSAGSGFTYVGREIGPSWGYVAGWSMVLDYLVQPIINVIFCSQQSHVLFPDAPYWAWAVFFTLLFTGLNVQGIKMSARFNAVSSSRYSSWLRFTTLAIIRMTAPVFIRILSMIRTLGRCRGS
jgi:putrescine importer